MRTTEANGGWCTHSKQHRFPATARPAAAPAAQLVLAAHEQLAHAAARLRRQARLLPDLLAEGDERRNDTPAARLGLLVL